MSRLDIDRAIDRYFEGAMGASERASFLAQVERDPETAHALAAESAIRSALAADRASMPIDRTAGRGELLSSLAALPASSGYSPAAPVTGGASIAATAIGSLIVVGVAVVAMLTGSPSTQRGDAPTTTTSRASVRAVPPAPSSVAHSDPTNSAPSQAEAVAGARELVGAREAGTTGRDLGMVPTRLRANAPSQAMAPTRVPYEVSPDSTVNTSLPTISLPSNAGTTPSSGHAAFDSPAAAELPVIVSDSVDIEIRMGR